MTTYHYISLYITIYHYISLYITITICQYSILLNTSQYQKIAPLVCPFYDPFCDRALLPSGTDPTEGLRASAEGLRASPCDRRCDGRPVARRSAGPEGRDQGSHGFNVGKTMINQPYLMVLSLQHKWKSCFFTIPRTRIKMCFHQFSLCIAGIYMTSEAFQTSCQFCFQKRGFTVRTNLLI